MQLVCSKRSQNNPEGEHDEGDEDDEEDEDDKTDVDDEKVLWKDLL